MAYTIITSTGPIVVPGFYGVPNMGCDIHVHVEVKIDGQWHHMEGLHVSRNYDLFSALAGVRGPGPGVAPDRGIPEDVSALTKMLHNKWAGDAHSESYITSQELKSFLPRVGSYKCFSGDDLGYFMGDGFEPFYDEPRNPNDFPKEMEDFRLVFWFDN